VFEILSPDSGRRDRIEKVREYAVVATITRYIIVESTSIGVLVLHRQTAGAAFTALPLTADDMLELPEANIGFPVAELYEDITFLD
jgi:Uma2 family endonuclease